MVIPAHATVERGRARRERERGRGGVGGWLIVLLL
jgi:hypothetical protein